MLKSIKFHLSLYEIPQPSPCYYTRIPNENSITQYTMSHDCYIKSISNVNFFEILGKYCGTYLFDEMNGI